MFLSENDIDRSCKIFTRREAAAFAWHSPKPVDIGGWRSQMKLYMHDDSMIELTTYNTIADNLNVERCF